MLKPTEAPEVEAIAGQLVKAMHRRTPPPEPGLYLGTGEEYFQWDALSASDGIEALTLRTPAHLLDERARPKAPSKIMMEGSVIHCAILEPEKFDRLYKPPTRTTSKADLKVAKLQAKAIACESPAESPFRSPIKPDLYDRALRARDAVWKHPECGAYLELANATEASMVWEIELPDGIKVLCKGRPDILIEAAEIIGDLKTVSNGDLSDIALTRTAEKLGYVRKAVFYRMGAKRLGLPYREVVMIACPQNPPFHPRIFRFSQKSTQWAADECRRAVELYGRCLASGQWPAYSGIAEIGR